jgi:hypothetical protein
LTFLRLVKNGLNQIQTIFAGRFGVFSLQSEARFELQIAG